MSQPLTVTGVQKAPRGVEHRRAGVAGTAGDAVHDAVAGGSSAGGVHLYPDAGGQDPVLRGGGGGARSGGGYAGLLSLGHGLFFALGGYAMGMYLMRQAAGDGLPAFMAFLSE